MRILGLDGLSRLSFIEELDMLLGVKDFSKKASKGSPAAEFERIVRDPECVNTNFPINCYPKYTLEKDLK